MFSIATTPISFVIVAVFTFAVGVAVPALLTLLPTVVAIITVFDNFYQIN